MHVVVDIEANGLNPSQVWVVCLRDAQTGGRYVYKNFHEPGNVHALQEFAKGVTRWIGHNIILYDAPVLRRLLGVPIDDLAIVDTLVVSRLVDADIDEGHSLAAWGERLGIKKKHKDIEDWSQFTPEMEERCRSDCDINYALYHHFYKFLVSPKWKDALRTEHFTAWFCGILNTNGFSFDLEESFRLLKEINGELEVLDRSLKDSFLPKVHKVSEVLPRGTKHGTLNRTDFRFLGPDADLTPYGIGHPFTRIEFVPFNPGSVSQIVVRLNEAGWQPTEKTKGHIQCERDLRDLRRKRRKTSADFEEIKKQEERLAKFQLFGWSVSEENLSTLPDTAPEPARKLARRLLLASRASMLVTWQNACTVTETEARIHGNFTHIGAWTGRMSHSNPNMGNIPKFDDRQPHKTPYSDRMRQLWRAGPGRLLVGVDAESIQLRIFGHYIQDEEFIKALVSGDKKNGTDPHSVNQRALGAPCKSRDDAKTFIYAWLLGAGIAKVAIILGCSKEEAEEAGKNFLDRYPGLKYLKDKVIPEDAERGFFQGFDGRFVRIWGDDVNSKKHFTLAGYLQNGEQVIMKRAAQIWYPKLVKERVPFWPVNFVHDEYQTETIDDLEVATYVAETQADAIRQVGIDLGLRCPMAGSVLNSHGKLAIGSNWMETH